MAAGLTRGRFTPRAGVARLGGAQECSSAGRAAVSKTAGRGFESLHSCQRRPSGAARPGRGGGIGRHAVLRGRCPQGRMSSSLILGTSTHRGGPGPPGPSGAGPRSQVVKAGVCKTPIAGSIPAVASNPPARRLRARSSKRRRCASVVGEVVVAHPALGAVLGANVDPRPRDARAGQPRYRGVGRQEIAALVPLRLCVAFGEQQALAVGQAGEDATRPRPAPRGGGGSRRCGRRGRRSPR